MIKTIHKKEDHTKEQSLFENPDELPALDYIWIDLLSPTEKECRLVEKHFSILLLDQEQSNDIEASSKVFMEGDMIVMNLIYVSEREGYGTRLTPVWFYLFQHKLLSVRTENIETFNGVRNSILKSGKMNTGSEIGFLLVDERIDHAALKMKEMILNISVLNGKINLNRDLSKNIITELNERMEYLLMFRIATMNTELTLSHLMNLPVLAEKKRVS